MQALLGVSLWIALATVVPGMVTIAVLYGLALVAGFAGAIPAAGDWVVAGAAVTIMVLTQSLGILLEERLTRPRALGPPELRIRVPDEADAGEARHVTIARYGEYAGMYVLLARLGEDDDAHGHLRRSAAQFFLTNNTLVSFGLGIVLTLALAAFDRGVDVWLYLAGLAVCLLVTYRVACIRFRELAKSLWAVRTRDRGRMPAPDDGTRADIPRVPTLHRDPEA